MREMHVCIEGRSDSGRAAALIRVAKGMTVFILKAALEGSTLSLSPYQFYIVRIWIGASLLQQRGVFSCVHGQLDLLQNHKAGWIRHVLTS